MENPAIFVSMDTDISFCFLGLYDLYGISIYFAHQGIGQIALGQRIVLRNPWTHNVGNEKTRNTIPCLFYLLFIFIIGGDTI